MIAVYDRYIYQNQLYEKSFIDNCYLGLFPYSIFSNLDPIKRRDKTQGRDSQSYWLCHQR